MVFCDGKSLCAKAMLQNRAVLGVRMYKKHHDMESDKILREQIFGIIENQIKNNDPPETKMTFKRLIKEGYNESDTKKLIAQCVAVELFDVLKNGKTFDEKRFIRNLKQLPKEPFD